MAKSLSHRALTPLLLVAVVSAFTVVTPLAASASSPVDDILSCRIVVSQPEARNYEVSGSGGSTGCANNPFFLGVEVCVDYNGITQPLSCNLIPPNEVGSSNPVPCVPGVWLTQATPMGVFGPLGSSTHSLPRAFVSECLNPHSP